jgi:hypothetical protein
MGNQGISNGQNGDAAWCVAMATAVLMLAATLEVLLSVKVLLFFLAHRMGAFSFIGSGMLLLTTLASAAPVFLIAVSWLGSFLPRRLCAKGVDCGSTSCSQQDD